MKTLWWVIFLNDSKCIHPLQAFLPSTPSKIRAKDAVCTGHTWAFEPKPLERSKYQCQSLVWWHYQLIGKFPLAQSQVSKRSGIRKPVANKDSLELIVFPITFIRRTFASLALRVKNFQKNLNKENHQVYIATLAPLSSLLQKASAALLGHVRVSTHRHSAIPLDRWNIKKLLCRTPLTKLTSAASLQQHVACTPIQAAVLFARSRHPIRSIDM